MEHIIKLDLREELPDYASRRTVQVKEGEKGILLQFQILEFGKPFDLTGYEVRFKATLPDGWQVVDLVNVADAENGIVTYMTPLELASCKGVFHPYLEVRLPSNEYIDGTRAFRMQCVEGTEVTVDANFVPEFFKVVTESQIAVASCNEATNAAVEATQAVTAATDAAFDALEASEEALEVSTAAAERANEAAGTANEAAGSANSAATTANASKQAADAAAKAANDAAGRANAAATAAGTATKQANDAGEAANAAAASAAEAAESAKAAASSVDAAKDEAAEAAREAKEVADDVAGRLAAGELDGATFTPSLAANGDLSWTNDKGKPNPPTFNVKGPKGDGVPDAGEPGQFLKKTEIGTEWADVVNDWAELEGKPTEFPPSAHSHGAADITSGTLPIERGGTGAGNEFEAVTSLFIEQLDDVSPLEGSAWWVPFLHGDNESTGFFYGDSLLNRPVPASQISGTLPVSKGGTGVTTDKALALKAYPVGSVYIAYNSTSPASRFGGSWAAITGRFPYFNAGTSVGGANSQKLSIAQMPAHKHRLDLNYGNDWAANQWNLSVSSSEMFTTDAETSSVGGGSALNNMPAYQTLYAWRRTA